MSGTRILIADDEPTVCEVLQRALASQGWGGEPQNLNHLYGY